MFSKENATGAWVKYYNCQFKTFKEIVKTWSGFESAATKIVSTFKKVLSKRQDLFEAQFFNQFIFSFNFYFRINGKMISTLLHGNQWNTIQMISMF